MTGLFLAVDPSKVKPGWVAFLIVLALCAATFLLWRNMNRQLHKVHVPTRAAFAARDREARQAKADMASDDTSEEPSPPSDSEDPPPQS